MLSYLITDPKYYTNNPATFKKALIKALNTNKIDIACFRDKTSSNFEELANIFIDICKQHKIKNILINSNLDVAVKLDAIGVHLTSNQFDKIQKAKQENLFTIVSCHCLDEILLAQQKGADMVTYSPIFSTPNKGEPKGYEKLKEVIKQVDIPVIALGGILLEKQIKEVKEAKAKGFASIRYFIKE